MSPGGQQSAEHAARLAGCWRRLLTVGARCTGGLALVACGAASEASAARGGEVLRDGAGDQRVAGGDAGGFINEVCDGSSGYTLEVVWESAVQDGGAHDFHWRNGSAFLRVDGGCRYYVGDYEGNSPIKSGTLTEDQADGIRDQLDYSAWQALAVGSSKVADKWGGFVHLRSGEAGVSCGQDCLMESDGELETAHQIRRVIGAADDWRSRLIGEGTPVSGPVRFLVFEHELAEGEEFSWSFHEWPLSAPIERFVVRSYQEGYGGFGAIGMDAEVLRALRDAPASHPVYGRSQWVAFDGGAVFYHLAVTDALPHEAPEDSVSGG